MARARPRQVVVEEIFKDIADSSPYRGLAVRPAVLRIRVEVVTSKLAPYEVVIEIEDAVIEVRTPPSVHAASPIRIDVGDLGEVFVAERPPRSGFFPWFGVFVRRPGSLDQLVLDVPQLDVARYVEHAIEQWLGIRDKPTRGEVR